MYGASTEGRNPGNLGAVFSRTQGYLADRHAVGFDRCGDLRSRGRIVIHGANEDVDHEPFGEFDLCGGTVRVDGYRDPTAVDRLACARLIDGNRVPIWSTGHSLPINFRLE
jgi:hypothetical protein